MTDLLVRRKRQRIVENSSTFETLGALVFKVYMTRRGNIIVSLETKMGDTLPEAPFVASTNSVAQLGRAGSSVTLAPRQGGSATGGFATSFFRPKREVDWANAQIPYHYVTLTDQHNMKAPHRLPYAADGSNYDCTVRAWS